MSDLSPDSTNAVELATELTVAWLSNANTRTTADDVPAFLTSMHDAIRALANGSGANAENGDAEPAPYTPAVSARKSLANPDHIISMIDGKPYKTLRRHLASQGLTPAEYRERYGLKADYPMVAPNYSDSRRAMAKKIGLGRKPGQTRAQQAAPAAPEAEAKPRRARKGAADAKQAAQAHLGTSGEA